MAVNPLSLAESLRPWRYAGVFALLPGESNAALADAHDERSCYAPGSNTLTFAIEEAKLPEPAWETAEEKSAYAGPHIVMPQQAARADFSYDAAAPPVRQTEMASRRPAGAAPAALTADPGHAEAGQCDGRQNILERALPDQLPEPWRAILSRTKPAPIIWTYAELGEDLAGRGVPERSACLRYMIGSLHLPKGSSAFWPVSLDWPGAGDGAPESSSDPVVTGPAGDDANSAQRFFQSGLRALRPKVVILLGTRTVELSGLAVSLRTPFTQKIYKGTLYVLLPDFHTLLSKAALKEQACVFLRSALSGLPLT